MVRAANTRLSTTRRFRRNSFRSFDRNVVVNSGFSLLEVTAVLVLMSTIAMIAVPRWTAALQRLRVSNAAMRIVADLDRAKSAAYSSSAEKALVFAVNASSYSVNNVTPLNNSSGPYVVSLAADPFHCKLISVWGQTGIQSVTFTGFGVPSRGGVIIIESGSARKTIIVDATSGSAVIQ